MYKVKLLNTHSFKIIFLLILILQVNKGFAQTYFVSPFSANHFQPNVGLSFATLYLKNDFILDFGIGLDDPGYDFSIMLNGSFRPYYKNVKFKEGDHFYIQADERTFYFSIDLEKRFYFLQYSTSKKDAKIGVYGLLKSGYYWGKYKGFTKGRNQAYIFSPSAGLSWQFNNHGRLNLGYLYFNPENNTHTSPHSVFVKLTGFFGK